MNRIKNSFKAINPTAWGIVLSTAGVLISGAYKLGFDNGNTKFDQGKINLVDENQTLKRELQNTRDSVIQLIETVTSLKQKIDTFNKKP